jgi:hypothetical protein
MLTWEPSNDPTVVGYRVYYGPTSKVYGAPVDVGNDTTHTVTGLDDGRYYFAVTAYNAIGLESGYSNEVSNGVVIGSGGSGCGSIKNDSWHSDQKPGQIVLNLAPFAALLILLKVRQLLKMHATRSYCTSLKSLQCRGE